MEIQKGKVCVIISCMHQHDCSIIERTNVQTDCVVVNQCDIDQIIEYEYTNKKGVGCQIKFISTTERGLSKSRNMAIDHASAPICLICDDDEKLPDNYESVLLEAYSKHPKISVACFCIDWKDRHKPGPLKEKRMSLKDILRTSSQQISFRRVDILKQDIRFDEMLGSGTGNGGSEEIKFLFDCKKCGLQLRYFPQEIAKILPGESQWFSGFTERYYRNLVWSNRRALGNFWGYVYMWVYLLTHTSLYRKELTLWDLIKKGHLAYFEKR